MRTIRISDNLHTWIMDHKTAHCNSAEKVIYGMIRVNKELKDKLKTECD